MSSQVTERVSRTTIRSVKLPARPFGLSPGELLAAAAVLIFFVMVAVYYFTSVKPEQDRVRDLRAQRDRQQSVIDQEQSNQGGAVSAQDPAKAALDSLNNFKASHLKTETRSKGETELYKELNALAKKNNLQLLSGIEVKPNQNHKDSERRKSADHALDVFPKLEIHFSVFGQFNNLRAFINELEKNHHFLVIDTLSLTSVEAEEGRRGGSRGQAASGGISLAINMTAYFQSW